MATKVDTSANGYPVSCHTLQGKASFLMGAHIESPDFNSINQSPMVNLFIEYDYPAAYKRLSRLGVVISLGCWLVYIGFQALYLKRGASIEVKHYNAKYKFGFPEWMVLLASFCLIFCICVYAGVHLFFFCKVTKESVQPLSRREVRHVLGSTGCSVMAWFPALLGLLVVIIKDLVRGTGHFYTFGFFCTLIAALVYLGGAWLAVRYINKPRIPIKCGFVISFLYTSGILVNLVAAYLNTFMMKGVLPVIAPTCNIAQDLRQLFSPKTELCEVTKWLQWTLTAGLNEEVLKFVVLLRLRSSLEKVVKSCWLTRCLRSSSTPGLPCCAWFLKLATSPMSVVLAGMASGAGLSIFENLSYITRYQADVDETVWREGTARPDLSQQEAVWFRVFAASGHISMTGSCAVALAYEMFIDTSAWRVKYLVLAEVILIHGTINASINWGYNYVEFILCLVNVQFLASWLYARSYMEPEYQRRQSVRDLDSWNRSVTTGEGCESQITEITSSRADFA